MDDINTRLSRLEGKYETDMTWLKDQATAINEKVDAVDVKVDNVLTAMQGINITQAENKGRDRVLAWGGSAAIAGIVSWVTRHL